jgi:hypothetical protein
MQLIFKNKHIYFALAQCWEQLPIAFKYQIQQAVTANEDPETDQSVTLTPANLMTIYKVVAGMPEGIAAAPNKSMKEQLVPQLMALAGAGNQEALEAIAAIQEIDARDQANRQALIEDSKQRILTA